MKARERIAWGGVIAALAALAAAMAASCDAPSPRISRPPTDEPEQVLDESLMVALALAKNHHHLADVYLDEGKVDEAIREVSSILVIEFPRDAPESEDALLDARARLAELYLRVGKIDAADEVVSDGIAGATRDSFFFANLHHVLGQVRHARARTLAGDAASAERRRAIEAYDRSIQINLALQKQQAGEMPVPP